MTAPVVKAAVLAVTGTLCALLIRRSNAELAAVLAMAVCAAAAWLTLGLLEPVLDFVGRAQKLSGLSGAVLAPVLKCVGLALTCRVAADLCRDGGQSAMAGAVELAGAVGALYVSLPLLGTLLDMLGDLA